MIWLRVWWMELWKRIKRPERMVGWVAWDVTGLEYDSVGYDPQDLPVQGIQAVMIRQANGVQVFLRGAKWYVWYKGKIWANHDVQRLITEMMPKAVPRGGAEVSDEKFQRILEDTD